MKKISHFLVILLLLQSCNVYHAPTSVEEAVVADKKVRIITSDSQEYKFRRMENKNDRLFGVTRLGSSTARKLAGMPAVIEGKFLKVDLSNLDIENISLRNESLSSVLTAVTIVGPFVAAYLTFIFFDALSDLASLGMTFE